MINFSTRRDQVNQIKKKPRAGDVLRVVQVGRTQSTVDKPLRAEILTRDGLIKLAQSLASEHRVTRSAKGWRRIRNRFEENFKILERTYYLLASASKEGELITPGGEWLLDNYHVIEQNVKEIRDHLPKGYYGSLPKLIDGEYVDLPRVYGLALEITSHTDAVIDAELLSGFIGSYQSIQVLTIGELWAFPIMLRIALLENLRRLALTALHAKESENEAEELCRKILDNEKKDPTDLLLDLASTVKTFTEVFPSYAAHLVRRMRLAGPKGGLALRWFEEWLAENLQPADEIIRTEQYGQAANQISIGNSFSSLKSILSMSWPDWFEQNSKVDAVLRRDPAQIFSKSDFKTRNSCRSVIEGYSRILKKTEIDIAEHVLKIAIEAKTTAAETAEAKVKLYHVGYYLLDKGKEVLDKTLGRQKGIGEKISGYIFDKRPLEFYLLSLGALTLLSTLVAYLFILNLGVPFFVALILSLLFIFPASSFALNIVNWAVTLVTSPRVLPKMDYEFGVPDESRSTVAVNSILRDREVIDNGVDFLEVRFIANYDPNISFALLGDLIEGKNETEPEDRELIEYAAQKISVLNSKYCTNKPKRFFLITRKRIWNPSEGEFLCWERKRGKLEEFNRLILGDDSHNMEVVVGDLELLKKTRYVITLDADTHLPRDSAIKLIGTISHPLNQAYFDDEKNIVVEGYGIIQPRIGVSLTSSIVSLFSRVFAGHAGLDPYTTAVSDVYQDLFKEGSFIGKAIYDVKAFERALHNRVPENALLSHDLFEGLFARAGLAVDIELIDEFPSRYTVYAKRLHRWVRGDWQLLPWIFNKIPNAKGERYQSPISLLGQWKLLDNLRRSLIAPASFLFLLLTWSVAPDSILVSTLTILAFIAFPVFAQLINTFIFEPLGLLRGSFIAGLGKDLFSNLVQAVLNFIFLPHQAYLMIHAILITLYRVFISKKYLLEWETAHQAEQRLGSKFTSYLFEMLPGTVLVILGSIFIANIDLKILVGASPYLALWLFAPAFAFFTGRPTQDYKYEISQKEREDLVEIARDTWEYFSVYMNEENNYLVPDNVQLFPRKTVAHRTSPTNISLSILSLVTAVDLKFIDKSEMLDRLQKTIDSLNTLERYNGHFYNWYETRTKQPLSPRYISTVDSGNFVGHLISLKNALIEFSIDDPQNKKKYDKLINYCDKFINEADFNFLYDKKKKLFYIGFRVDDARFDNNHYDLLASEARLASLVAIATKSVPQEHWFSLGRGLTDTSGGRALLSWTGTMFEYLMPLLVMKDFPKTILHATYRSIIRAQKNYGIKRKVPWGMSESGYCGVDFEQTYQYRAFGVPGLGLKRGLSDDIVVSPYSTFLAMMVNSSDSIQNVAALEKVGLRGDLGFYESVDYTPDRLSDDEDYHIVKSYLAHHQGMTLISLNNVLNNGIMQERFHRDPLIRSSELLLQERVPQNVTVLIPHQAELSFLERQEALRKTTVGEIIFTPHTQVPRTRVLSNDNYTVMLDNAGSGFSRFKGDTSLTRWREDPLTNSYGTYFYVRDLESNKTWSTTYMPTKVEPDAYEVIFSPDKVEYKRRDYGIGLHTEITVSPEDDVEVRRITITNFSLQPRILEFTSFAEVALGSNAADISHPAFNKMFIQSEFISDIDGLLFSRRPRSAHEEGLFLLHMIAMNVVWGKTQYETSREKFIGRGSNVYHPQVFNDNSNLTGTVGPVIDPIFSLRVKVEIEPGTSESLSFITAVAKNRGEALFIGQLYHDPHSVNRAFEMAWSKSNVELRHEQISVTQSHIFQRIANALFFQVDTLRGPSNLIAQNRLTQSGFWRFGISGDLPIIVLKVNDETQLKQVSELILAHQYLKHRRIDFDLIILNEYTEGYIQNFQDALDQVVRSGYAAGHLDKRGGIFVRTMHQLSSEERTLLMATARIVFIAERGSLARQLSVFEDNEFSSDDKKGFLDNIFKDQRFDNPARITKERPISAPAVVSEFFNGYGGFTSKGKSYYIKLSKQGLTPRLTPLPWINVIANPNFGFLVSETGGGFTWSENSRENRLSGWSNDPVSDSPTEAIYIRDGLTGDYWSATPLPSSMDQEFEVEHNFGSSIFKTEHQNLQSHLCVSGSIEDRVKFWNLNLQNNDSKPKRLELYLYVDWVLGINRHQTAPFINTGFDQRAKILTAINYYNNEFAGRIVYLGSSAEINSYTTSRLEFIGRNGSFESPIALAQAVSPIKAIAGIGSFSKLVQLSKKTGAGFESCAVLKVALTLNPGQKKELSFFMGEAYHFEEARELTVKYRSPVAHAQELDQVNKYWSSITSRITINTPDRSFDILMNGWLIYQCLSCRIWGRSGLYQSGGAYGFRDQLQDTLSLLYLDPTLTRAQILRAAARQFLEGDVQHWWHPPTGRGVRTRISDDYLWLPYVVEKYISVTGDSSILDEEVGFIDAAPLEKHQMESYIVPHTSNQKESIYNHCIRAINYGLTFGSHGLPLIGAGDWNDGMNEVGSGGQGESVWLGWFLYDNLRKFSQISELRNDQASSQKFSDYATKLLSAIEEHGWDGEWYRRAYFDNGSPIGSAQNSECQIDSIAQSWSLMSGAGDPARSAQAMESVFDRLVDDENRIIKLLTPPFDTSDQEPGYIKGYLPGIRENGGQYTHAACWVVIATALLGKGDKAMELWSMLNPITHTSDPKGVDKYKGEPYVLCGDVYSQPPHEGRAGWSWYTGSCGWLYVAGIEHIVGLKVKADHFTVNPCIPKKWDKFDFTFRHAEVTYLVTVINPEQVEKGVKYIEIEGQKSDTPEVSFARFEGIKEVNIKVFMGKL